jgi:hypothetical protein
MPLGLYSNRESKANNKARKGVDGTTSHTLWGTKYGTGDIPIKGLTRRTRLRPHFSHSTQQSKKQSTHLTGTGEERTARAPVFLTVELGAKALARAETHNAKITNTRVIMISISFALL